MKIKQVSVILKIKKKKLKIYVYSVAEKNDRETVIIGKVVPQTSVSNFDKYKN